MIICVPCMVAHMCIYIYTLSSDIRRRFCITAQLQSFSARVLYVFTFFFLVRGAEDEIKCTLTGSVKTRQFAFKCNLTAPLGFSQTPLGAFYFVLSPSDEKKKSENVQHPR